MGVIMILINIISRKNIYQNKLLMRYLKIVELDITRNQPNTGFLKEILELFYAMIFLSRGNCNLQKYSYHPYFWGKSQNILSSIIWMIVSYDDVFTTIIGTSVIFMNSLLLIGYVYLDFTKNKS